MNDVNSGEFDPNFIMQFKFKNNLRFDPRTKSTYLLIALTPVIKTPKFERLTLCIIYVGKNIW